MLLHAVNGGQRSLLLISRVDMSKTDVLVQRCVHALEGRGKTFREALQASSRLRCCPPTRSWLMRSPVKLKDVRRDVKDQRGPHY